MKIYPAVLELLLMDKDTAYSKGPYLFIRNENSDFKISSLADEVFLLPTARTAE
jgi:hypothetical protein